jgi:hypothetical protein
MKLTIRISPAIEHIVRSGNYNLEPKNEEVKIFFMRNTPRAHQDKTILKRAVAGVIGGVKRRGATVSMLGRATSPSRQGRYRRRKTGNRPSNKRRIVRDRQRQRAGKGRHCRRISGGLTDRSRGKRRPLRAPRVGGKNRRADGRLFCARQAPQTRRGLRSTPDKPPIGVSEIIPGNNPQ